jgi:hypothetical protein
MDALATAPTLAHVAMSTLHDPAMAGADAARRAIEALGAPPSCCLVFGTTGYDQAALLAGVHSVAGDSAIVGCSGEGVIAAQVTDERERVVSVLAIRSSAITFETLVRTDYATAPEACGTGLAAELCVRGADDVFALLVFADGLGGDCMQFLGALQAALPPHVVVVGGTAGDAMAFRRTYQYAGEQAITGGVTALVLRGRGSARVTAAADGWLREIDGQPAWSVFKEYLDGDPQDLNAEGIVHLCFGEPLDPARAPDYDPYIIHTPLQLDATTGALFFPGGGFAPGTRVRLTRRDPERIRASAERCARSLVGPERPAFVIQFDCAGRGQILFGHSAGDEIVRPLQSALGGESSWIGLHTYGEIAPVGGKLRYHNYTVALCAVYDHT